jgi:hypothetical protein
MSAPDLTPERYSSREHVDAMRALEKMLMIKTATDWIAYLEAEPRSEPHLSIAAALREQAQWIDRASALLPLVPRDAGTDLARELSELLSAHPPTPYDYSACDEHETTFPKDGQCPKCVEKRP